MLKVENEEVEKSEIFERQEGISNINNLPEGCISDILSLTSPTDACRSSIVSTLFKSAADSDVLWEKFLPADYQEIISRAFPPLSCATSSTSPVNFYSKKELYHRLCVNPILIDGGLKSFQLEKCTGKKCIMLGAKELGIAWGDDPRYWRWLSFPGSRFVEVAELNWVCWLAIRGKLETRLLSPETLYGAYLVLKLTDDVGGFDEPVKGRVEVVGGDSSVCSEERRIYLNPNDDEQSPSELTEEDQYSAQVRGDGWMEVELGHFYNEEGEDNMTKEVHMSLLED
ncbi:hypothetical protein MKW94_025337 [Papaver nudicaule]|uniref:F-box domain-containing protein n=1 Tax=Papaver nudicaule TaxID=74823 RepID=A0AA41VBU1_PAPNU|nr:hypothetical protein [Papaver nudicaule]MCL7052158.1 hypothetical protein [Papaver nudicaule]